MSVFTEKDFENALRRVRRAAAKEYYSIHKGRDCMGFVGFVVVNSMNNSIEGGEHFDLSLSDIANWFDVELPEDC